MNTFIGIKLLTSLTVPDKIITVLWTCPPYAKIMLMPGTPHITSRSQNHFPAYYGVYFSWHAFVLKT